MGPLPEPLDVLDADDREILAGYLVQVGFEPGDLILAAGEDGDACYLIDGGEVRLEMPHPELDTDEVLGYLEAGSMLGELSLLDRRPRSATAYAETEVECRRLSVEALDQLTTEHPHLAARLVGALGREAARKLRSSNEILADHLFVDTPDPEVDEMVARARAAQEQLATWDEERIDALLSDLAQAVADQAEQLATETVEETRIGNVQDKTLKNVFASLGTYQSLVGKPGIGPIGEAGEDEVLEYASPVGVVFGLIPVTNPVATAIFKALIALKARNALIMSFHRACLGVGNRTGELFEEVLRRHDAPVDVIQWIKVRVNRKKTARFMGHPGVDMVLATGGPGMVRAAYSSGTPAIGVGSGNTPTWVTSTAEVRAAAEAIVASKSFDNGLICGSEHNLVVDRTVRDELVEALEVAGAAVLDDDEAQRFLSAALTEDGASFRIELIGQSAELITGFLEIRRDHPVKVIVVPTELELSAPLAREKMTPVLSLFTVDGDDAAIALSQQLLDEMGAGHTSIVHSTDDEQIERFAAAMPTSRVLVNSPGAQGVCGITTGLEPSFTLGCGTFGGTSTTDNVTYRHLQNIRRVAHSTQPAPELSEAVGSGG